VLSSEAVVETHTDSEGDETTTWTPPSSLFLRRFTVEEGRAV
jgi:hypothetical protein